MTKMKLAVGDMNCIIPDLSEDFDVVGLTEFLHADGILLAHEASCEQGAVAEAARHYGIPTFTLQHGRHAMSDYVCNEKKPKSDYVLVWGRHDADMAVKGGWPRNAVVEVGCPLFDEWVHPEPDGKTVVFAPAHVEALDSRNQANDRERARIWAILLGVKGIHPIIKLLGGEHTFADIPGEKVVTVRGEKGHVKRIYELLKHTSCVVSQAEGTFELLAYSMNIPVIKINNEYNLHDGSWNHSAARKILDICELEAAVREALEKPEIGSEARREKTLSDGGVVLTNAAKRIRETIKGLMISRCASPGRTTSCKVITYMALDSSRHTQYRLVTPMHAIAEHNNAIGVKRMAKGDESVKIADSFVTDVIVFPPMGKPAMLDSAYRLKDKFDKRLVFDMDLNVFDVNPYSAQYGKYGQHNAMVGDVVLWEHGKNINLHSNRVYLESVTAGVRAADVVTVPTEALASVYRQHNRNVVVLPDCLDFRLWKTLPLQKGERIKLGWHGDAGKLEDVAMLKNVLPEIMRRHDNVDLVLIGGRFSGTLKDCPQDRVFHYNFPEAYETLPYLLAGLGLDIGLVPHKRTPFSRFELPLQFLEYSALSIPSIVSSETPFDEFPEEVGVFVNNEEAAWLEGLEVLIGDSLTRCAVGGQAHRYVKEHHDIETKWPAWVKTYESLYGEDYVKWPLQQAPRQTA